MTPAIRTIDRDLRCGDIATGAVQNGRVFGMLVPRRGDSQLAAGNFCQFKFLSDPSSATVDWRATVQSEKPLQ